MRLLLIQFCTVLSPGAFSQKIAPNNKVIIENFPKASTYSIKMQFSDGKVISLGSSKVYVAAMFPQLDKLKMIKAGKSHLFPAPHSFLSNQWVRILFDAFNW